MIENIHAKCGPGHTCYLLPPHSPEMNVFKPGKMIGITLVVFFSSFVLFGYVFNLTSVMMGSHLYMGL